MKSATHFCCFLIVVLGCTADEHGDLLDRVQRFEQSGKFIEAAQALQSALSDPEANASPEQLKELAFELDRLERIRQDYPLTREALLKQLEASIRDVTEDEFLAWIAEGKFDRRDIDGQEYFVAVSRSNLFWRYPEIRARRINPPDRSTYDRAVWSNCAEIKEAALSSGTAYVLPKKFDMEMTVTADAGAAPPGSTVRAWLPIPRLYPYQKNFRLLRSQPAVKTVDDDHSPIRSAYFEQVAVEDSPVVFQISYEYTTYGVYFNLREDEVISYEGEDPEISRFLMEGPHVKFTADMQKLSTELIGSETNPLRIARTFYNWIAENIQYSYALEYSTIRNIGEYCLTKKYGDCGQEALLFITLCRFNGIPARWQSGWYTFPGGKTIHDWTEIYLKPYGWIPVDPYMGIFAMQYLSTLDEQKKKEVRDFFFGGLDQYRMAANSDHSQSLSPEKKSLRSDTVDFQRGELEAEDKNIYFDKYSYRLKVSEL